MPAEVSREDLSKNSLDGIACVIGTPSPYSVSDSVMKFKRFRDVNVDWKKAGVELLPPIEILKNYFSSSWNDLADDTLLSACKGTYWKIISLGEDEANVNEFLTKTVGLSDPTTQGKEIFAICESDRTHAFVTMAGLITDQFINEDWSVKTLWSELGKIDGLQRVIARTDPQKNCLTFSTNPRSTYVSRNLHFQMERYYQIKAKHDFVSELIRRIENSTTQNPEEKTKFAGIITSDEEVRKLFQNKELLEFSLTVQAYMNFTITDYASIQCFRA